MKLLNPKKITLKVKDVNVDPSTGYLHIKGVATVVGVRSGYTVNNEKNVSVYFPESIIKEITLQLNKKPLAIEHPNNDVTIDQDNGVGLITNTIYDPDTGKSLFQATITKQEGIDAIKKGKRYFSYKIEGSLRPEKNGKYVDKFGVMGEANKAYPYDYIFTKVKDVNHLALTSSPRTGKVATLLDSTEVNMTPEQISDAVKAACDSYLKGACDSAVKAACDSYMQGMKDSVPNLIKDSISLAFNSENEDLKNRIKSMLGSASSDVNNVQVGDSLTFDDKVAETVAKKLRSLKFLGLAGVQINDSVFTQSNAGSLIRQAIKSVVGEEVPASVKDSDLESCLPILESLVAKLKDSSTTSTTPSGSLSNPTTTKIDDSKSSLTFDVSQNSEELWSAISAKK